MDYETLFKKYRKRLALIGAAKASVIALIAGFIVMSIAALVTWFTESSLAVVLGVSLGLGFFTAIVTAIALYVAVFRPATKTVARKLDELGLDERMITMCEYAEDSSYIADIQRNDAKAKLDGVSEKRFKFEYTIAVSVALIVSFSSALGLTTASSLAAENIIDSAKEIIDPDNNTSEKEEIFSITYYVKNGGGRIVGETYQEVKKGENGTQVIAEADAGYKFYAWTDESGKNVYGVEAERVEFNVRADKKIFAVFVESNKNEHEGGGDHQSQGSDPTKGDSEGDDGENKENGDDSDDTPDDNGKENEQVGNEGDGTLQGRGNNNVIDGKTDYREEFDREKSEEELNDNESVPDDLKDVLGDYYGSLKP